MRHGLVRVFACGLGTLVLAALDPAGSRAATPFVREVVDAGGTVGQHASLAFDAIGNPHISYYDATNGDLEYATRSGSVWKIETVDAGGNVGQYSSLALDAGGNPRIGYYDVTNANLKYASRSGSTWTIETVDATGDVGQYASLALDAQGEAHVSYWDTVNHLKYARRTNALWVIEIADPSPGAGRHTSLALDSEGNPHISHYNAGIPDGDLKYATKAGGVWISETVDTDGDAGLYTSLVLDPQGVPRISYQGSSGLKYAAKDELGSWNIETVDLGDESSLALDLAGNPRIAYYSLLQNDLRYASKSGGTWTLEVVDLVGTVGLQPSLALDRQGNPAIAYFDATSGDLQYTDSAVHLVSPLGGERWAAGSSQTVRWRGAGSVSIEISDDGGLTYGTLLSSVSANAVSIPVPALTTEQARLRISRSSPLSTSDTPGTFSIAPDLVSPWWAAVVEPSGNSGLYTSLALESDGSPRIGYYDLADRDLEYAMRAGSAWTIEKVDTGGDVGLYASLALDVLGNPRLGYYDVTNADLKYAARSGALWAVETVDAPGTVGQHGSLALDAQSNPRISYYDGTNFDLKYAARSGGIWSIEVADATGNVGQHTSIDVDGFGNPHISYHDVTNGDLKYARKTGLAWTRETVDAAGGVGLYTSLALDGEGNPHIGYYDATNGDLKYARKSAGLWAVETVDAAGTVGLYTSLALDGAGNPRIGYYDAGNADLKYASKWGSSWMIETVDALGTVGQYASLALDAQGNPRISYYEGANAHPRYASAAIELAQPSPGDVWPVGAPRSVTWGGTGRVDAYLSVDGGSSWQLQQPSLTGGSFRLQVPHTPSRFAKFRLERAVPYSVAVTGLFSIETSISLLSFAASPGTEGGADLSWQSDPGPEDLAGYRLERADPAAAGGWRTLVALTRSLSHHDPEGGAGARYRLFGINGLGDELLLGEAALLPARPLAAWPLPYRGGSLNVSFSIYGRLGDAGGTAEVALHDLAGRRVKTLARGSFTGDQQVVTWDGRDRSGRPVPSGMYFLVSRSGDHEERLKILVLP